MGVTPHLKSWKSDWKLFFSWKDYSDKPRQAHGEVSCNDKAIQPHEAGGDDKYGSKQQTE
jgi:hypothetical protein